MKEILLGMLILTSHSLFADFRINGTLLLDDPWEPIIYMSEIQSFEQMYTVDEEMIVCASKIDSSGSFILKGDFLPKEDRLYRLHLCKKGDPVSTIIIGGKEENFFFLIANHNSQLSITDSSEDTLMTDLMISGDYPNDLLSEIHALVKLTEYQDIQDFPIGRKYMRLAVEEKLRNFADTCQHPLLAMYALYHTDYQSDIQQRAEVYRHLIQEAKESYFPYTEVFSFLLKRNKRASSYSTGKYLLIFFSGMLAGWIGTLFFLKISDHPKQKRSSVEERQEKYQRLSLQERKILSLIASGHSNQDIATELHIGMSTVKSHVRNIYQKLGIHSRKDAVNFTELYL